MKNYIRNKKGNILIASYFIVALLLIFGAIFLSRAFSEIRTANLFENTAKAFQAAEAAISQAVWGMNNVQVISNQPIQVDSETTSQVSSIIQTLTTAQVVAIANSGTATKTVATDFENYQYGNAITSGKDLVIFDQRSIQTSKPSFTVQGTTALSGNLKSPSTIEVDIEELYTGINPLYTKPNIPDLNGNGGSDSGDFITYFDTLTKNMKRSDPNKVLIISVPKGENTVTVDVGTLSGDIELVYISSSDSKASTKLEVEVKGTQNNPQLTVATAGQIKSSVSGNGSQNTQLFTGFSYSGFTLNTLADKDKENLATVAITFGDLDINITKSINAEAIVFAGGDVGAKFKTDGNVVITGSDIITSGAKQPTGLSESIDMDTTLPPYKIYFGDASSPGAADVGGGQSGGTGGQGAGGFGVGFFPGLLDPFEKDNPSLGFFWQKQDTWEEDWSEDK